MLGTEPLVQALKYVPRPSSFTCWRTDAHRSAHTVARPAEPKLTRATNVRYRRKTRRVAVAGANDRFGST